MNTNTTKQEDKNDEQGTEVRSGAIPHSGVDSEAALRACEDQSKAYLDGWQRAQAALSNYQKDEKKRLEEFLKYANEDIVMELLDVLDNLELAIQSAPEVVSNDQKHWFQGVGHVIKQFHDLLAKYGVQKIIVQDIFDPTVHEAVEIAPPDPQAHKGKSVIEIRPGYIMNGKVLRPSRVRLHTKN